MFEMIRRILNLSDRHKSRVVWGIIFNILKSLCMALMLMPVFLIFENINSLNTDIIRQVLILLILSIAGRFLFQWQCDKKMCGAGFEIFRDYRLRIGERLKQAPMGYFSEQRLGIIHTVLTTTISQLESYSMLAIADLTGGVAMAVIISVMLTIFCWPAGLLTLAGLLLGLAVLQLIRRRAASSAVMMQEAQEDLTGKSLEYIRGISVLRTFKKAEEGQYEVEDAFERKRQADYRQEKASAGAMKLYSTVFKATSCVLLFLAGYLYLTGGISLSYCLMFLVSAFLIYSELELVGDGAFLSRQINTQLDRLEAVTNIPEIDTTTAKLHPKQTCIELREVSFAYENRRIIHDVSLKIAAGSTCAIVGPSGSGKTTICNLIARFWDVQEGAVLVDGRDVREYTADSLLANISMVFQNVYLFHDTIENNIKFGKPDAAHTEVVQAAKRACCHNFIMALPDGYNTMIGEGGSTLSGGEKQRISIARAILKDAPIVILDEATSSVDPENEHELLNAIGELTKNKTLITIAHRLTTVRDADQIVVVDQGRIVQNGIHDQLMKQDGIYRNFLKHRSEAIGWQL